jgi:hypothetical protein
MDDKQKISKRIVTILLLIFTAVTIVYGVIKEIRKEPDAATAPVTIDGDILFYFHGNQRCATCKLIERAAKEAVQEMQEEAWGSGITFKVLNREKPENSGYVKEFKILGNAVIVASDTEHKTAMWKNLDKMWLLSNNKEKLKKYFKQEFRTLLEAK